MALGVAFKAFFAALSNRATADRIRRALESSSTPAIETPTSPTAASPAATAASKPPAEPARSEALTLLSTLQREARFLDLVQEPLDSFEDAQIGAAAREVLRDCKKTLDRMFAIAPLASEEEGATCQIEASASPSKYRLVGNASGNSGTIAHRGWKANSCEVPKWTGSRSEAWILTPIEVDVS